MRRAPVKISTSEWYQIGIILAHGSGTPKRNQNPTRLCTCARQLRPFLRVGHPMVQIVSILELSQAFSGVLRIKTSLSVRRREAWERDVWRLYSQANFEVPGMGIGGVASVPNSYWGGLRSSLELRIISGVMTSPV